MIESFRHRGLSELFETGRSAGIRRDLQRRAMVRLDALDAATSLDSLHQPGFNFHPLARQAAALLDSRQRAMVHHL